MIRFLRSYTKHGKWYCDVKWGPCVSTGLSRSRLLGYAKGIYNVFFYRLWGRNGLLWQ